MVVAGILLMATGAVWIFQGAGSLHGSFMTGSPAWLWIGVATAAAGLAVCLRGFGLLAGRGRPGPR
jgi:hypothetical protein